MAEFKYGAKLFLNEVDLSEFVRDVDIQAKPDDRLIRGLKPVGPITLTLDFDTRSTCPLCGLKFTPPRPPHPMPHVSINDGPSVPVCDACVVQHLI